ncbi:hypothetical protein F4678DRAFT_481624 [Xylaria arbuscula]|nr:hypothetical protein F4678DRAFT_481624 [Xylaria arbuscula]
MSDYPPDRELGPPEWESGQEEPDPWNLERMPVRTSESTSLSFHSGAASLVNMCAKTVAQHVDELDKTHLQDLPTRVLSRIWGEVKRGGKLSVETWKLMASTLTRNILNDAGTERHICPLLMNHGISTPLIWPLMEYIDPLLSDTFSFLTHLIITGNINGSSVDLLDLVMLKNLAVLEIIDHSGDVLFPRLTDSVLQQWSTTPGAFPVLRILRVWGERQTTIKSLRYIHVFPSLVILFEISIPHNLPKMESFSDIDMPFGSPARQAPKIAFTSPQRYSTDFLEMFRRLKDPFALRQLFCVWTGRKPIKSPSLIMPDWNRVSYHILNDGFPRTITDYVGYKIFDYSSSHYFWGFFLYSFIGTLLHNRDLSAQGLKIGDRAFSFGGVVLPPRPLINVHLG